MPDPRFFEDLGPVSLTELAAVTGAVLARPEEGDTTVTGVAPLQRGDLSKVSFYSDRRYLDDLKSTLSGAVFVTAEAVQFVPPTASPLVTREPHAAYAAAANRLHRPRMAAQTDPLVHPSAQIEDDVRLGHGVSIGAGARIGRGSSIGAYSVIGPGVVMGRNCRIGGHVTIGFALIGDNVGILAGAVIGEPGFGVTMGQGKTVDIPQLGRVILQDNVGVGANSCIDRGAWDDTVIGENTKIDNLVQIAHNVRLGRNCLLAAHTGISGSCHVGDGVVFGGRAGLADHIVVGDRAKLAAAAGVMKDVPADEMWAGLPARPVKRFMRETAWLAKMAKSRGGDRE